jgi:hypothetical protein
MGKEKQQKSIEKLFTKKFEMRAKGHMISLKPPTSRKGLT